MPTANRPLPVRHLRLLMLSPRLPIAHFPTPPTSAVWRRAVGVVGWSALLLGVAGGACAPTPEAVANGDDPIAALRSTAASTRYTAGYWLEQARTNAGGRWTQATAYCGLGENQAPAGLEAEGARPNCRAVWSAHFRRTNEQSAEQLRARVEARAAQAREQTPAQRKAAEDSMLIRP